MIYKKLSLTIQGLTKSIDYKPIFSDLTCAIAGKHIVGVVGENGIGKSTMDRILVGKRYATAGRWVTNGNIGYLPQEFSFSPTVTIRSYLRNFVEDREDYKIRDVLEEVGLHEISEPKAQKRLISQLSGGQQRKLAFAKLLLQEKNILILDEPTNHLDKETRNWLENWMNNFSGMLIVISHDRVFLNVMCDGIIEMKKDSLQYFDGNYESYKKQKAIQLQSQRDQYVVYEKRKKKMEAWLHRIRQHASVSPNPALGRLLKNKEKYFSREVLQKAVDKPKIESELHTAFIGGTHGGKSILQFVDAVLQREGKILCEKMNAEFWGKQRILLTGANGTGKSTLLQEIKNGFALEKSSVNALISGLCLGNNLRICYVDQHQRDIGGNQSAISAFMQGAHGIYAQQEQYAKSILVQFGITAEHWQVKVHDLSYGQRVRIRFAQISTHVYDLLIFDEPTNHLDIPTREAIEQALVDYEGALLIVSHDEYFVQQVLIDTVWEMRGGRMVVSM